MTKGGVLRHVHKENLETWNNYTPHFVKVFEKLIRGKNFPLEVYVMENSVILYTEILMLRKINYYSFYKFNNVFFAMPCVSLVTDQSKT